MKTPAGSTCHSSHTMASALFSAVVMALFILLTPGCIGSASEIEADIQSAEMAVAQGDMKSAHSIAEHIVGNRNLSGLSASQLGRLSMVYMQIADNDTENDTDAYIPTAADCYKRAFAADSDSADAYYSSLAPELLRYAVLLSTIVSASESDNKMPDELLYDDEGAAGNDSIM